MAQIRGIGIARSRYCGCSPHNRRIVGLGRYRVLDVLAKPTAANRMSIDLIRTDSGRSIICP